MGTNRLQGYKPIRILRYIGHGYITEVSCNQHVDGVMKDLAHWGFTYYVIVTMEVSGDHK